MINITMPVIITSFQPPAGPVEPILSLTGYDYSTDNYELTNPSVTQTDRTIVSLWFKWDYRIGDQGELFNFMIHNSGGRFYVDFSPAGQIQIKTYNAAVSVIQLVASSVTGSWRTDDAWHHVLYSREGTTAHLYIDDVEDKFIHSPNTAGNASNNSANHWYHGMAFNNTFGFKGCLSNVYENHQEYLDFSIEANRRKFISATGEPVDPGNDGSGPTGLIPEVWVPNGLPTTNDGVLGNYSLVSGSGAVACDTHPLSVVSTAGAVLTETIGVAAVSVVGSGVGQIDFGAQFGFADFDNPGTDSGGTDYISVSDTTGSGLFVAPGAFTFEMWVKIDTFNTDTFVILAQSPGTYITIDQFFIQINRSNGTVVAVNQSTELCRSNNSMGSTGTWYHLAVTRDDTNQCRIWVNGVQGGVSNSIAGAVGVDDGGGNSTMYLMGGPIAADNSDVDGKFNGFRWINGKALYRGAGNITIPTVAPF